MSVPARMKAGAIAALLAVIGLVFLGSNGSPATADSSPVAASAGYSALNRPASAADRDNAVIRGAAAHDASLLVDQARTLQTDGNVVTWLIPTSSGKLCLALQPADRYAVIEKQRGLGHPLLNYVCNDAGTVASRGMVLRTYNDITGLVPDGVRTVAVTVSGNTTDANVDRNIYHADATHAGFSDGHVTFATDGQEIQADLP